MEELLRNLGVKAENMLMSFFAATIFVIIRIYEPEVPLSRRKVIYVITSGAATALLVPGLVVYWFKVDNAFMAGFATAVVVLSFEFIVQIIREKVIRKLKDKDDETRIH